MKGYVIVSPLLGVFLGDDVLGRLHWSKGNPPPDPVLMAAPVFPSEEAAIHYTQLFTGVPGLLLIQEVEPDLVGGMWYVSMGRMVQYGHEPWMQPDSPCIGPMQ